MDLIFKEWRFELSQWDVVWIIAVCVQLTVAAAFSHPKWKSFISQLPVSFTAAALAVGQPIDATHILGLILFTVFTFEVRFLYRQGHVPIVGAMMMATITYFVMAWVMAAFLPHNGLVFWIACVLSAVFAVMILRLTQHRRERLQRTVVFLWLKLAMTIAIVIVVVQFKGILRGFVTTIPILAFTGIYESRNNLWTVSRQVPVVALMMIPMMVVCHIVEEGQGPTLGSMGAGWLAFLIALAIIEYRRTRRRELHGESHHRGHNAEKRHSVVF